MTHRRLHDLLAKHWGFTDFRAHQEDIINALLSGEDVIGLLPTGGGKSLCYQLPSLILDGLVIVISPLISLMQDQYEQLRKKDIPVEILHSGLHSSERRRILDEMVKGRSMLVYMAPERLQSTRMLDYLENTEVKLIAVDEAHCISQWGHEFRPAYLKIAEVKKVCPRAPILALTGTATQAVLDDIRRYLSISNAQLFKSSFERKNIAIDVQLEENKSMAAVEILKAVSGSQIVYVRTRRRAFEISQFLDMHNIKSLPYHAGMQADDRERVQQSWMKNEVDCIVATSAFGMGVDKGDVRIVIHMDLPPSLEDYYQEIGRAGRDGDVSRAVCIYNKQDGVSLLKKLDDAFVSEGYIRDIYQKLLYYFEQSPESLEVKEYAFDFDAFTQHYELTKSQARSAILWLVEKEYLSFNKMSDVQSRLHVTLNKEDLFAVIEDHPHVGNLLQCVLRRYEGLFSSNVPISEIELSKLVGIDPDDVLHQLKRMHKMGIIDYQQAVQGVAIKFTFIKEWKDRLEVDHARYVRIHKAKVNRAQSVLTFIDTSKCRVQLLLKYFGESKDTPCGTCDNCRIRTLESQGGRVILDIRNRIIDGLETTPLNMIEIERAFKFEERPMMKKVLRELLGEGKVGMKGAKFALRSNG